MGIKATERYQEIKGELKAYYGYKNHIMDTMPNTRERRSKLIEIGSKVTELNTELENVKAKMEIEPIEDYLVSLGIEENGILPIDHMVCRICHQEYGDAIYLDASVYMDHDLNNFGKNVRVKVIYNSEGRILLDGILSEECRPSFFKDDTEFHYFKEKSSSAFVDGSDVVISTINSLSNPEFVHYKFDSESGKYVEAHRFSSDVSKKKRASNYKQLYIPLNPFLGVYNGRLYNTREAAYKGNLEFDKIIDYCFHMDDVPYIGQPRHIVKDKITPILESNKVLMGIDTYRIKGADDNENLNIFVYLDSKGNIVGDKLFYMHEYRTKGYNAPRGTLKCIGVTNETYDATVEELKKQADKERIERSEQPVPDKIDLFAAVEREMLDNLFTIEHSFDIEPQKVGIKKQYTMPNEE